MLSEVWGENNNRFYFHTASTAAELLWQRGRRGFASAFVHSSSRSHVSAVDDSLLMELPVQQTTNEKHPTLKRTAKFNHVASFCPHCSDVQRPNTAVHRMTGRHFLADFLQPDIHIFNDTASMQHITQFKSDLGIFFSIPLSFFSSSQSCHAHSCPLRFLC